MNIQQQAFKLFLENRLPENCTKYFSGDYPQIIDKVNIFKKKNGETPSIDFLMSYSSKLGENVEQAERISDLLYGVSKIKDDNMSVKEVCELLLDSYKDGKLRELIKKSSQALVEDNILAVERYSKEISEISRLSLGEDNFLKNDIKDEVSTISSKLELVSTGIFPDSPIKYPFSHIPVGSMVCYLAKSGMGKSTLTLQAAQNLYLQGRNILNINVELQKGVILGRLKANLCGIPLEELSTQDFQTTEAMDLNFCYDYVMKYELTMKQALSILSKKGYEKAKESFEAREPRKNIFKIISAEDKATNDIAKEKGLKIDKLPTDVEILQLLEDYGDDFDDVYIDLISELHYTDSRQSREQNITNFARELKALAMEKSFNAHIVSQVEDGRTFWGQLTPKYAKSLFQSSDLVIGLISNSEMDKDNLVGIVSAKARHANNRKVPIVKSDFQTMQFIDMNELVDIYEFEAGINKELKKQGDKK